MPEGVARGRRAALGGGGGGAGGAARPSGLYRAARTLAAWALVPDSYAPWRGAALRAAATRVSRGDIDAVLTSSPPDTVHLVGLDLKRAGARPWVADFRDPWVGLTYKRPPTAWHAWRQRRLRSAVLGGADLILATTRASMDIARSLLGAEGAERVLHLPNGWEADVDPAAPAASDTPAPAASGGPAPPAARETPLRLVYTGTLWDVAATRTCLAALARALAGAGAPAGAVRFDLVGPYESAERRLAADLGLAEVARFRGQVTYAESRALQAGAGVLVLLQASGPGYEVAIPGKLYEYVASGRPILAFLAPGEAADLVRESGGWVVPPDDERGAAEAFARLVRGERPGGDSPARRALADAHRRDRIAARLAAILDGLVSARAGSGR
jgi:glycosyltransferase involved in cell wall biosynthesis